MAMNHWMSWEGGVDLIGKTSDQFTTPNVILHVARMVHTPVGSAPAGMILWQPDPAAAPLVFGFVSSSNAVATYISKHLFTGTPFGGAPAISGEISIEITAEHASARVEIPGFLFKTHLAEFSESSLIQRDPQPSTPFHQQGLEAVAGHACLKVNGEKIPLIMQPEGNPAVVTACGHYTR